MARLRTMPAVEIPQAELAKFGAAWVANGGNLSRTPPYSSPNLGALIDSAVGNALAEMLGGLPIVVPKMNTLIPSQPDCVEVGPARVIGGVRPQNFDVAYRPDGIRFAFDSKTLNDRKSIPKNWQNMINDIATEATTVHSRFPYAVVAFFVMLPVEALAVSQRQAITETLERLARRNSVMDPEHQAEAIALVLWHPDGTIDAGFPASDSPIRLERFSETVAARYAERYKGLPPHAVD